MKPTKRHKKAVRQYEKAFRHLGKISSIKEFIHIIPRIQVPLSCMLDQIGELAKALEKASYGEGGTGGGVSGQGEGGPPSPGGNSGYPGMMPAESVAHPEGGGSPMAPIIGPLGAGGTGNMASVGKEAPWQDEKPGEGPHGGVPAMLPPGPGMGGGNPTTSPDGAVGYTEFNPGYPSDPSGALVISAITAADIANLRKSYGRGVKLFKHVSEFYWHPVVRQQSYEMQQKYYSLLDDVAKNLYGGLDTSSEPRL